MTMAEEPITDLTYIEQTSKANERENLDFRAFVKADLDLSDYRLNNIVKQATQEVWNHIDCRTCANCCKTRHPLFSRVEVQRIANHLGMTAAELRARYLEVDQESAKYITRERPCPFLQDNLCSIYDVRPSVCAGYPHLHRNFRNRSLQTIDNAETCPIVFNVLERLKQQLGFRDQRRQGSGSQ
jgi:Fe-S-cluster containining protein